MENVWERGEEADGIFDNIEAKWECYERRRGSVKKFNSQQCFRRYLPLTVLKVDKETEYEGIIKRQINRFIEEGASQW